MEVQKEIDISRFIFVYIKKLYSCKSDDNHNTLRRDIEYPSKEDTSNIDYVRFVQKESDIIHFISVQNFTKLYSCKSDGNHKAVLI